MEKFIGILQQGVQMRLHQSVHYHKQHVQAVIVEELGYIPHVIHNQLQKTPFHVYSFVFQIGIRHIQIHFHLTDQKYNSYTDRKMHKYFENVYLWFYFITKFAPSHCSNEITVNIYLTDHKKQMVRGSEPIDIIHANSAVTTGCSPKTSIYIYREEEWFKVLMHECFHNLGLDFSNMDEHYSNRKMLTIFPITSHLGIRIYESYCETWATFMNCLFISFLSTRAKINTHKILEKTIAMLEFECSFSLIQCAKVLNHYDMTYRQLVSSKRTCKFVEKTHVLSYYIVKCVLLCHFDEFLTWCRTHNRNVICFNQTYENIDSYIEFIRQIYNKEPFLGKNDYIQDHSIPNFQDNTLRMTVFG
jgi:hypothetical protein